MKFTYNGYIDFIKSLKAHNYSFCGYNDWRKSVGNKVVILRHDIDNDIRKALQLAKLEKNLGGGTKHIFCIANL